MKSAIKLVAGGFMAVTLGGVAAITAGAFSNERHEQPQAHVQRAITVLEASFPIKYESISDLARASDVIVVGDVTSSSTIVVLPHSQIRIIETIYDMQVTEVVGGSMEKSHIPVLQVGGRAEGEVQELREDPFFITGEQYVLFLDYAPETQRYHTVGGHQGRFILRAGSVSSLSLIYPNRGIDDLRIDEMPTDEFKSLVR